MKVEFIKPAAPEGTAENFIIQILKLRQQFASKQRA